MGTVYGYARCSTDGLRQDIDRQKRELFKMGVTDKKHIYWEYASGAKTDRPEFLKLMDVLKDGDTIAVTEVSRLTRSMNQLCEILKTVQDRHLCLLIGTMKIDCRDSEIDPMTKGMLMMWGVFSEMERDMISARVKSGMKNAIAKGKVIGRPAVTKDTLPDKFWKGEKLYENGDINASDFARMMECSRTTLYKYMKIAGTKKPDAAA